MPKIAYVDASTFRPDKIATIKTANGIIAEYQAQGFDLTLRQLYYQFVARGLISNKDTEYKRLGGIINDGRMGGMIDWFAIVDRTRNLESVGHWNAPSDVIASAAAAFRQDKWKTQPNRVEVWVEKEALAGVMERACVPLDVPYFSCRGYVSQSEMWAAAMRLRRYESRGQTVTILHFGDHDPSGIDMSRDIEDRLSIFGVDALDFRRLALNEDQIETYNPPPNPAKITDSRADKYIERFGTESWELDALDPTVLVALVTDEVKQIRDSVAWDEAVEEESKCRAGLRLASNRWDDVEEMFGDDEIMEEAEKEEE